MPPVLSPPNRPSRVTSFEWVTGESFPPQLGGGFNNLAAELSQAQASACSLHAALVSEHNAEISLLQKENENLRSMLAVFDKPSLTSNGPLASPGGDPTFLRNLWKPSLSSSMLASPFPGGGTYLFRADAANGPLPTPEMRLHEEGGADEEEEDEEQEDFDRETRDDWFEDEDDDGQESSSNAHAGKKPSNGFAMPEADISNASTHDKGAGLWLWLCCDERPKYSSGAESMDSACILPDPNSEHVSVLDNFFDGLELQELQMLQQTTMLQALSWWPIQSRRCLEVASGGRRFRGKF